MIFKDTGLVENKEEIQFLSSFCLKLLLLLFVLAMSETKQVREQRHQNRNLLNPK
jgi:hypothetical protein